jgi:hypothetical protein
MNKLAEVPTVSKWQRQDSDPSLTMNLVTKHQPSGDSYEEEKTQIRNAEEVKLARLGDGPAPGNQGKEHTRDN